MNACVCVKVCEIHHPPPQHTHSHAHAPVGAHAVCRGGHGRGTTGMCERRLGVVCKDGIGRGVVCHVGCGSSVLEVGFRLFAGSVCSLQRGGVVLAVEFSVV